jgi:hypothetical protein
MPAPRMLIVKKDHDMQHMPVIDPRLSAMQLTHIPLDASMQMLAPMPHCFFIAADFSMSAFV